MKRKLKKLVSLSLVLVMSIFVLAPTSVNASNELKEVKNDGVTIKEEILSEYHTQIALCSTESNERTSTGIDQQKKIIKEETIQKLHDAGYEAYDVNVDTFDEVEDKLSTNLEDINLDKKYSYIIILEGDNSVSSYNAIMPSDIAAPASTVGTSFTYTLNGKTYTMRFMTVTAADDPAYGKASSVNVLKSNTMTVIENCLDTAISALISSVSSTLGTVASICGLSVSNFSTSSTSTMYLNGGTNWTRIFTQVYDSNYNHWMNGSCVEYVHATAYMSGLYYSSSSNAYEQVPGNERRAVKNSSKYFNDTWRKEKAVYGFENYWTQYDTVGDVKYYYGGTVKITHSENF